MRKGAMETRRYNGWTNHETRAVALWIGRDQLSRQGWREAAAEARDGHARDLLDRAGRLLDDARRSLREERPREALGSVRAASALALDVAERLGTRARN